MSKRGKPPMKWILKSFSRTLNFVLLQLTDPARTSTRPGRATTGKIILAVALAVLAASRGWSHP